MIKLLDIYILKKYFSTFFFVVLALVMVICLIDFTEKHDDYMSENLTYGYVFKEFYLNFIPYLANFLSPVTVFIATILVTARMASHTEIVAMLSTGMSFRRILATYAVGAAIIGAMVFLLIGWVIPKANVARVAFEEKHLEGNFEFTARNVHIKIGPNLYAYMESYNNAIHTGYNFTLEVFDDKELLEKLKSNRIQWDTTKQKWFIDRYEVRSLVDGKEVLKYGRSMDTTLNLFPSDFESKYKKHETLTLPELDQYITEQADRGMEILDIFVIEKYERYTYPFSIIILTVIGVIVSARKSREGIGFQIALGFVLAFVFILFVLTGRSFVQSQSVHPLVGAWIPNTVFSIIGYILYKTVPR